MKCTSSFLNKNIIFLQFLSNKGMKVNLYKPHSLPSYFFSQPNNFFPSFTFPPSTKHKWGELKSFLSSYFSTPSSFPVLSLFYLPIKLENFLSCVVCLIFIQISVCFGKNLKASLLCYSTYFCYYSWASLHFLILFMGPTVLFQLTFTFIYNTFSNKFLVSAK